MIAMHRYCRPVQTLSSNVVTDAQVSIKYGFVLAPNMLQRRYVGRILLIDVLLRFAYVPELKPLRLSYDSHVLMAILDGGRAPRECRGGADPWHDDEDRCRRHSMF